MNINSSFNLRDKEPEDGVLYLVGTPIGNLSDISFRALNILKNVFLIACEDTRQTKKILSKYEFSNKLISFNKLNSTKKIKSIIDLLKDGNSIALVSDAGLPGICDPGESLVKESKFNGIDIICVPGASALLTALVCSGYETSKFIFEGFLPKKKIDREKLLLEIKHNKKTTVIYESPHRLLKTLNELKEHCGGEREIQVFREITKKHEEHIGENIEEVMKFFKRKDILGEFTLVIKGSQITKPKDFNEDYLKKEINALLNAGLNLSSASKYLAKRENISKRTIYNLYNK